MAIPEPAVRRSTLVRSAAVVWASVGLYLSVRAVLWFRASPRPVLVPAALALVLGFIKGQFIFSKLARGNIERIGELAPHKDKICIFAFQAYESYVIIVGMMTLGILLRHSALSRDVLAVVYLAIGSALVYGSGPYWRGRQA
jgi:hypothetical protein